MHDDRRIVVAIAQFDAVILVLAVLGPDELGELLPMRLTGCAIGVDQHWIDARAPLHVHVGVSFRPSDVALGHRAAFALVAVEQRRATPAVQHCGELPADVDRVAHAGVHAIAAGGNVLMHRIAREKHAALAITLGEQQIAAPHAGDDHFVDVHPPTQRLGDQILGPELRRIDLQREVANQRPGVDFVLRDQRRRRGEEDVPELAMGMQRGEIA